MIRGRLLIMCMMFAISFISSAQERVHCVGALPATMTIGDVGYVTDVGVNNVRDSAGTDGIIVGTLQVDEHFTVISAPVCADGYVWYEVENDTISGWTAESGDGDYWLLPVLDPVTFAWDNIQHIRTLNCAFLHSFSFSQSGDSLLIACGGRTSQLLIYEMESDRVVAEVDLPFAENIQTAHYVADDSLILASYGRNTFGLLDAETFEPIQEISLGNIIHFTNLSLDRTLMFHLDDETRTTVVYDTTNLQPLTAFPYPSDQVITDNYNSRILLGSVLLTVDSELNIINQQDVPSGFSAISPNMDIAIAPACTYADHGCQSAEIRWLDLDTLEIIRAFGSELIDSGGVTFSSDGSAFLLNECGTLTLNDTQTFRATVIDAIAVGCGGNFTVSPDWRYIVTQHGPPGDEFNRDYIQIYRIGDE